MGASRAFVLVANRALATGSTPLDDLPGAGGRFDVVTRFVVASLLTSHGARRDTDCVIVFTNIGKLPKALRVMGAEVQGLRPDERTTAAILNRALIPAAMPVWQASGKGMETRTGSLEQLFDGLPQPRVLLDQGGTDIGVACPPGGSFFFGDQDGLTADQLARMRKICDATASLGPVPLQSDQAAVVVHNFLDRATVRPTV